MKKERAKDIAGIILLYAIVLFGIVLVNARMGQINEANKNAVTEATAGKIDN